MKIHVILFNIENCYLNNNNNSNYINNKYNIVCWLVIANVVLVGYVQKYLNIPKNKY